MVRDFCVVSCVDISSSNISIIHRGAAGDIPEHLNITLFDGSNVKPTPFNSKAVGEPPLMLALSTYFALRDAVSASADHKTVVHMNAPATPERILMACERAKAAAH